MNTTIQSLHFTANEKLTAFVNEKMDKIEHVGHNIQSADVCLKLDKSDTDENKICEIRLTSPGNNLFARNQCSTFEAAIADTVEDLQKQLRKVKTKRLQKRRTAV